MAKTVNDNEKVKINPILTMKGHDLMYVPGDGNCLISSIILGYLGRFKNKPKKFMMAVKNILPSFFDQEQFNDKIDKLFHDFENLQNSKNINQLKPLILLFRKRIADYIKENLDISFCDNRNTFFKAILNQLNLNIKNNLQNYQLEIENWKINLQQNLKESNNNQKESEILFEQENERLNKTILFYKELFNKSDEEKVDYYLSQLTNNGSWCETIVVDAICNILESNISIKTLFPIEKENKINILNEKHSPTDKNIKAKSEINLYFDPTNSHYSYYQINSSWQKSQMESLKKELLIKKETLISLSLEEKMILETKQDKNFNDLKENQTILENLNNNIDTELCDIQKLNQIKEENKLLLQEIAENDFKLAMQLQKEELDKLNELMAEEQYEFACD